MIDYCGRCSKPFEVYSVHSRPKVIAQRGLIDRQWFVCSPCYDALFQWMN